MSRLRRDPRAERAAHGVEGGARPRFDLAAAPAGKRPRRDPRAEQRQATVPGTARLRLDRTQRTPVIAIAPERPVVETAPQIRIIAEPAFLVAAVPDAPGGRLTPHDRQLLGAARLLADAGGGAVLAIVPDVVEGLGAAGADRVLVLADNADFDPEGRADAIGATLAALKVRHALFAETADGGDLARRIAAELGEPLFTGAESLTAKAVTRPARGRRVEQRMAPPRLLTIAADAVAPHGGTIHEAKAIEAPPSRRARRRRASSPPNSSLPIRRPCRWRRRRSWSRPAMASTDFDAFRALAVALSATPGASRVVCDAGLMPRAAQVGASGTVLEAACYFALGIAGAPQHLQGVAKCEHVVAVNTDLHAAMIERAGLAVVADAQLVMPAIIAALKAEEGA